MFAALGTPTLPSPRPVPPLRIPHRLRLTAAAPHRSGPMFSACGQRLLWRRAARVAEAAEANAGDIVQAEDGLPNSLGLGQRQLRVVRA